jgi:hydrogenase maturation protein HypF
MPKNTAQSPNRRIAVVVRGVVQGVGFRPFVYQAAKSRALGGWVLNEADLVRIEVQGAADDVAEFLDTLRKQPPPQSRIDTVETIDLPCQDGVPAEFEIRTSEGRSSPRPTIPADLATCADCLAEIFEPNQRRRGYPFTNCTNCGPRWTIIEQLPYDRPRTSMKTFAMCDACRAEYENPADRRFHAQPIACPNCGPHLELLDARGEASSNAAAGNDLQAIRAAAEAILAGKILALEGLGGFQLIADATNADAVALLRERKRRPDRPFALMMRDLTDVRRHCAVSAEESQMLDSHRAPIVLLRRLDSALTNEEGPNRQAFLLADEVAPENPYLGVMLPCTPLHHLLMAAVGRPIVCTSGNISEEPMAISFEDAMKRLGHVADLFLTHNRPIVRPVDDSIVRFGPAGMQVLRRARGFAPLPISVESPSGRAILAVGGHLKNTISLCLAEGGRGKGEGVESSSTLSPFPPPPSHVDGSPVILSAHTGDLDSAASVEVFRKAIDDLTDFYKVRPDAVVCDLHPDYASTRHAETLAARWNVPLFRVQHHHAHVAACMAEHGLTGPVLGFAWDGTGYGTDGTIWGGEAIVCPGNANLPVRSPGEKVVGSSQSTSRAICDPDSANWEVRVPGAIGAFSRASHLRTFSLPGGDAAARQPRRSALGVLFEIFGEEAAKYGSEWFSLGELKTLMQMLRRKTNCPRTSSLGRLFDAVAAIVGIAPKGGCITFEGQAAMALEFAAASRRTPTEDRSREGLTPYRISLKPGDYGILIADWAPLILAILADRAAGASVSEISFKFHVALAEMAVETAKIVNLPEIVLSGGCLQNAVLLRETHSRLIKAGFQVFFPQQVPPGDGGIALGQIFIAGFRSKIE